MNKNELIETLNVIDSAFRIRNQARYILDTGSPERSEQINNMIKKENAKKVAVPFRFNPFIFLKNLLKAALSTAIWAIVIAVIAFCVIGLKGEMYNTIFMIICGIILIISYIAFSEDDRENIKARIEQAQKHNRWVDSRKNYYKKCQKAHTDAKAQRNKAKEVFNQYNKLLTGMFNKIGIHEKYRNHEACLAMIDLLETGRADTLKEAINLYETNRAYEKKERAEAARNAEMMQMQEAQLESMRMMFQADNEFRSYQLQMDMIDDIHGIFNAICGFDDK